MNNLVPEKRLDRVGKMVTRWVKRDAEPSKKNSILGTVIPTIPVATGTYIRDTTQSDKALRVKLLNRIRLEIQSDFNNQVELAGLTGQTRNTSLFRMQDRLAKATQKMEELESSTLQVILGTPCKRYSLMNFVTLQGDVSELQFRERMHYMVADAAGNGSMYHPNFIDKVRSALDVDDLSSYPHGSTEREVVASALNLLHHDWRRRSIKVQGAAKDEVDEASMRHLLGFLMEHPEKAASINQFLLDRDVSLDEVDIALLDEYVNSPIPALGDGIL